MRVRPGRHVQLFLGTLAAWLLAGSASAQVIAPVGPPDVPVIKMPVEEACVLKLTDGRLVFSSKLPYTGVTARPVEITGLPGESRLTYRPYRFTLDNEHVGPDGARVWISLERRRSYFRYQRTVRQGEVDRTITFTQSYADDDSVRLSAGRAKLTVVVDGDMIENIDAVDFVALRREHPRAFYRDMVPSIRLLRADPMIAVDAWEARQVLAERVPNEAVPEIVRSLVAELGDKSFRVRERAVRQIAGLGQAGAEELKEIDPLSLSPEQSLAVDVLLKKHTPLSDAEADRLRSNVDFLLDCLYCEEDDVTAPAIARLEAVTGKKFTLKLDMPVDERGSRIEVLRAKLSPPVPATNPATKPAE